MSKARKRHRQPWWKRKFSNRKKRKRIRLEYKTGKRKLVSFVSIMQGLYPKGIGA